MGPEQTTAIERVRRRVRGSAFYPPRERQSLLSWASNRGHGALGGLFSAVFDAGGRDPFAWELFGATPFFEEPAGDFGECAVILVAGEPPDIDEDPLLRRAVVVSLDLDELTGRDGLVQLVESVVRGLRAITEASDGLGDEDHSE